MKLTYVIQMSKKMFPTEKLVYAINCFVHIVTSKISNTTYGLWIKVDKCVFSVELHGTL